LEGSKKATRLGIDWTQKEGFNRSVTGRSNLTSAFIFNKSYMPGGVKAKN
jgi:hypothetical protein